MIHSSTPSTEDLHIIRDGDVINQLLIIKKFSQMNTPAVIHPLLEALAQGKEELIEPIADALVILKSYTVSTLLTEITNSNCFIRWGIAVAMQKIGDSDFINALIPAIGLGYLPTIDVILETLTLLEPRRFPEPKLEIILKQLTDEEKNRVGPYAILQLGTAAFDSTESLVALKILDLLNWERGLIPIIKATHHPDIRIRQEALHILGDVSDNILLPECERILNAGIINHADSDFILPGTENNPLYYYAIEGLGLTDSARSRKLLLKLIRQGNNTEKIFAISALEKISQNKKQTYVFYREIQRELENLLHISERGSKIRFIQVLGKIKESWAVSAILLHIHDQDWEIRFAVVQALLQTMDPTVLEKAPYLLIDEKKNIRKAAVNLYWKLDPGNCFGLNEGDIILKLRESIKNQLFERMCDGLQNWSAEYREFAAFWMGIFRYEPAYPILISNLTNPSENVVISMIVALGMFGNKAAIEHLIPYIYNSNGRIQRKTIESIGSLGLDGLYTLIHELYQNGPTNPPFLEEFIMTFGGRILNYLSQEIEQEKIPLRRERLSVFHNNVLQRYQIQNSNNFNVLL